MAKRFVVLQFEMEEDNPQLAELASARCWSIPGTKTCEGFNVAPDTVIKFEPLHEQKLTPEQLAEVWREL